MFSYPRLVLATTNHGKIRECEHLLRDMAVIVDRIDPLLLPEPEENGDSFEANARLKADYYGTHYAYPVLADDSGLAVDYVDGQPGIYSGRWAQPNKNYQGAVDRIFAMAGAKAQREGAILPSPLPAHFVCVLALRYPNGSLSIYEGQLKGMLLPEGRGTAGFGYDPYFIPEGFSQTIGELGLEIKASLSHRAKAMAAFRQACFAA